jgi:iron(III) transport system ATP-binding protein
MIEFKGVSIRYGDFTAIENLNLVINKGEFFTFLGPSGCGKTTILRSLVGFINPAAGTIEIDGRNIINMPIEKRKIGIVFQNYALFPTMSVYENIAFGLKIAKIPKDVIKEKVLAMAEKIDLDRGQLEKNISELSGGQQQRVALARAIIMEPDILCLDEPLSNLDAKLRVGLRTELKRLQKDLKITTLYVTHDQEEALTLSDRLAVFNKGKIEQVGMPDEIYNCSASEFVCCFIGDINILAPPLLEEAVKQSGKNVFGKERGFIRLERINSSAADRFNVSYSGIITDREFYGTYTKCVYRIETSGGVGFLKCVEKNDGSPCLKIGDSQKVYLDFDDIMLF